MGRNKSKRSKNKVYHTKIIAELERLNTMYGVGVDKETYENNDYLLKRLIIDKEGHAWFQIAITKKGGVQLYLRREVYLTIRDKLPTHVLQQRIRYKRYLDVFNVQYSMVTITENIRYVLNLFYKTHKDIDMTNWRTVDYNKKDRVLYTPKITMEEFYEINRLL